MAANEVSEVTGLRVAHASGRVGDRVGVTACRVDSSGTAHLSGKRPVCSWPERLSRRQGELVCDRRRQTASALENLPANGVELAIEADAGSSLNDDRDRERCNGPRVTQSNHLFVIPGAVGVDPRCYGNASGSAADIVYRETERRCPSQTTASPGDGDGCGA